MIPFQRQVYEAIKRKEAEEKERRMEEARGGSGGRPKKNSLAGTGGKRGDSKFQSETVRYKTDGENTEANTSFIE